MATHIISTCDRCGDECHAREIFREATIPALFHDSTHRKVDLCFECIQLLHKWLKELGRD